MIENALKYLVGLAAPPTVTVDGRTYATGKLEPVRDPLPQGLVVHSLRGVVDYIEATWGRNEHDERKMGMDEDEVLGLHIVGPREVRLVGRPMGAFLQRAEFCRAEPATGDSFPFGQYMDPESFLIRLTTMFVDHGDRADILSVVGNLRDEAVATLEDDGVTQTASARKGLNRAQTVKIVNPVDLAPFRTFHEVEQPAGLFVLRMRGGGDGKLPQVALFEVDDGAWRTEAIDRIRAYFVEKLPDVAVIG